MATDQAGPSWRVAGTSTCAGPHSIDEVALRYAQVQKYVGKCALYF